MLLRQADLLAKSLHSRVATEEGKLRGDEVATYPRGAEFGHAIEGRQGAILVAQTGINKGLGEGVRRHVDCDFLGLLAASGTPIRVTEIARVAQGRDNLNGLVNSPLA